MGVRDVLIFPRRVLGYIGACGIFLALILPPSAFAATFTVTNLNDSGIGSLRQAILDANNAAGNDTIVFQAGLSGILLTTGGFTITDNLTINGLGKNLSIKGNNALGFFAINSGVTANFSDLTIQDGQNGAINNSGTLTLTNSTLSGNSTHGVEALGTMGVS